MRALLCGLLLCASAQAADVRPFLTGVDANYAPELEARGRVWRQNGQPVDPIAALAAAGADAFRVRLWVGDDGGHGLRAATALALRAQAAGMKPYVVLFLSEGWADFVKQPAPAAWRELTPTDKAAAVEAYATRVTRHLVDAGVAVDLVEVGNEIDFGVCGVFEEDWAKRVSTAWMAQQVWPQMAPILAAAERGVRQVRPQARFVLHLTRWAERDYNLAFWRAMIGAGVTVDVAGLSWFPTSGPAEQASIPFMLAEAAAVHAALGRPVLISELAYPSEPAFPGQFAAWNHEAPGYPLDEAGQARWLRDALAAARASEDVLGAFYWSPEWYDSGMWEAFALFGRDGAAKPALGALAR